MQSRDRDILKYTSPDVFSGSPVTPVADAWGLIYFMIEILGETPPNDMELDLNSIAGRNEYLKRKRNPAYVNIHE